MKNVIDGLSAVVDRLDNSDVMDDYEFTNRDVSELTTIFHLCASFIVEYERIKEQNGFGGLIASE